MGVQKFHNEELHSLYRSPDRIRLIKSRRLRWAGHVARMKEVRSAFNILTGKPIGNRLYAGLGVDERTILEWTLKKWHQYEELRNSYEKVKTFKFLGSLLTNQNSIQEEIKCRIKAGNSCYYSVQTLFVF